MSGTPPVASGDPKNGGDQSLTSPADRTPQTLEGESAAGECKRLKGGLLPNVCPPEWGEDAFGDMRVFEYTLITEPAYQDCFSALGESGSSTSLPPESAECARSPRKRCEPVSEGEVREPWEYVLPQGRCVGPIGTPPRGMGVSRFAVQDDPLAEDRRHLHRRDPGMGRPQSGRSSCPDVGRVQVPRGYCRHVED